MDHELARIEARSRRQAMEWSLVLVSQGIETIIANPTDDLGWALLVNPLDYAKAKHSLHQYRLENRGWSWQRKTVRPGIIFDWASLAWSLLLFLFFWLDNRHSLHASGFMDSAAVTRGEWWRLFTATWLHADIGHLASNATMGFLLLGLTMGRYGTGVGLLAAYLAGVGGNIGAWLVASSPHYSLGASGVVMGALGLLGAQSFSLRGTTVHAPKLIVTGIVGGLMLFVLFGMAPETDVIAHSGGFISGLLLGLLLTLFFSIEKLPRYNLSAGFLFAALTILPWWTALSQSVLRK